MSVAATWVAMGYLPIARPERFCTECAKSEAAPDGLRCTQGHFYVNRTGGCKSFVLRMGATAARAAAGGAWPEVARS